MQRSSVKAVGLFSGGLDSTLAAALLKKQGIEVHVVHFVMPWGSEKIERIKKMTESCGLVLKIIQLDDAYLDMLTKPVYGYGGAFNPCIDCHAYMIRKAADYMREIKADFIFTGEVVGQRPMSQVKQSLNSVLKLSQLKGRVLRPLCAQLLKPTIPEEEGKVDRKKLLAFSGRSRKPQIRLASELGIEDYPNPAGGCLLTDKNFGLRIQDWLKYGRESYRYTKLLKWGRHFRVSEHLKVILGRDERENSLLMDGMDTNHYILEFETFPGPNAIVCHPSPSEEELSTAAGLIQFFSKARGLPEMDVLYWKKSTQDQKQSVKAKKLSEDEVERMAIYAPPKTLP